MTADCPRPAGEREQIAAALHADMGCWSDEPCPWCEGRAAALLPVVDRIASERAAAALKPVLRLAAEFDMECRPGVGDRIRRAAALRAATTEAGTA